ncbi:TDT family transporter [Vibrio sp. SM6]|uniref:TDT family transporter n=1 Tax=Vibrio agarilyticus TaxID=2726741 RepID=A0A7X8YH88_9VIBR|nr:TDT family transporter [Vibrio agarilyticus]NLS13102.1 TDT family transporter [Vibrio agarilyticus]
MNQRIANESQHIPTPLAGLALGIASLGVNWSSVLSSGHGYLWSSAIIASLLLLVVALKYALNPHQLIKDVAHPILGSVLPTFSMTLMLVSISVRMLSWSFGETLWLVAVALHLLLLLGFGYFRLRYVGQEPVSPSWFIPPVGILVAVLSFSGNPALLPIAWGVLILGMVACVIMLPLILFQLIISQGMPDAVKPNIAILAAPASLCLAGYLVLVAIPSPLIIALFLGMALLMTAIVYIAFFQLLRLPLSPSYASYTFPIVISATALLKLKDWLQSHADMTQYSEPIQAIAMIQLWIATIVVLYVVIRLGRYGLRSLR